MLKLKLFLACQINVILRKIHGFELLSLTIYTLLIGCLMSEIKKKFESLFRSTANDSICVTVCQRNQIVALRHEVVPALRCIIEDR